MNRSSAWRPANAGSQGWLVAAVNAIVDHPSLKPLEKLILLTLARWCDGRGVCSLYRARVAASVGSNVRWVKRCLARLIAQGFLIREECRITHDRNGPNVYRVCLPLAGLASRGGGGPGSPPLGGLEAPRSYPSDRSAFSSGSITYKPPNPPRAAALRRGGVLKFSFGEELVQLAGELFPLRYSVARCTGALNKLRCEPAPTDDELVAFLRFQSKYRNLQGAHVAIAVACDADDFAEWIAKRRRTPKRAPSPPAAKPAAAPRPSTRPPAEPLTSTRKTVQWAARVARAEPQNTRFPRRRGA